MIHSRKDIIKDEGAYTEPDRLSALPPDLLRYSLFGYLGSFASVQLAKTSHLFNGLPEYKNAAIEFEGNLRQLLSFVAQGEKKKAEELILQYPALLLVEGQTSDYSSYYRDGQCYQRKLQGTAFQIALGAEDVNLSGGGRFLGEGMVEMIQRHLKKLPNGEAIIAEQIQKQFPAGWEEQEEKEHELHLSALHEVWDVIKASSSNEECQAAIRKFKDALAPPEIITRGKHWDAKLLQAAFKLGEDKYFFDFRKDNLFYNAVIGYIQTLAPANYAMAQAQGLKYLLADGADFDRNLKYHHGGGRYYPLSDLSGFRLGSNSWVDCYSGRAFWAWGRCGYSSVWVSSAAFFKNYVGAKTTVLRQFMPQPDVHTSLGFRWCAVM